MSKDHNGNGTANNILDEEFDEAISTLTASQSAPGTCAQHAPLVRSQVLSLRTQRELLHGQRSLANKMNNGTSGSSSPFGFLSFSGKYGRLQASGAVAIVIAILAFLLWRSENANRKTDHMRDEIRTMIHNGDVANHKGD